MSNHPRNSGKILALLPDETLSEIICSDPTLYPGHATVRDRDTAMDTAEQGWILRKK
jgi:hypothetical protein